MWYGVTTCYRFGSKLHRRTVHICKFNMAKECKTYTLVMRTLVWCSGDAKFCKLTSRTFFLKVAETGSSLNPPLSMIYCHISAQNFSISYLKPLKVPKHETASTAVSVVPIGPLIIPTPGGLLTESLLLPLQQTPD